MGLSNRRSEGLPAAGGAFGDQGSTWIESRLAALSHWILRFAQNDKNRTFVFGLTNASRFALSIQFRLVMGSEALVSSWRYGRPGEGRFETNY